MEQKDELVAEVFTTPVGPLLVGVRGGSALAWLSFADDLNRELREMAGGGPRVVPRPGGCAAVGRQLAEYFAGRRRRFDLPLAPRGTEFQRRVWDELTRIPFGETISYRELARRTGNPAAVRAVGQANGANPIAIVIPCHRVIARGGGLGGYGGGLDRKRQLLELERGGLF